MHVNCADFVYKAMGELIQVLYQPSNTMTLIMNVNRCLQQANARTSYSLATETSKLLLIRDCFLSLHVDTVL